MGFMHIRKNLKFSIALVCVYFFSSVPFSQASPEVKKNPHTLPLSLILKKELKAYRSPAFEPLLKQWETRFGSAASMPLITLAQDKKNEDSERYIALMGAMKLGGPTTGPKLLPFLKDSSWMIRSGALRCLKATRDRKIASLAIPLLKDPALVVRSEAIDTILALRPDGSVKALLKTLLDQSNYNQGKALFVPKKALVALAQLNDKKAIPFIKPLLNRKNDPELLKLARETINAIK